MASGLSIQSGVPQAGSQIANRLGDLCVIWMTETIQFLPLGC